MAEVTFIGLGNMGLPMALNLLKSGHSVKGFDLAKDQVKILVDAGGQSTENIISEHGNKFTKEVIHADNLIVIEI